MGSKALSTAIVLGAIAALLPFALDAEAACSPRTFASLGAAPNAVPADPVSETPPPEAPVETPPPAETPPSTVTPPPADVQEPPAETASPPAEVAPEPVPTAPIPAPCRFVYRMEFPVVGGGEIGSVFGDVREAGDRWHAGIDIFAPKLTPVVAARAGTVFGVHDEPGDCCWVSVRHTDGWMTLYVHLNNDRNGTDDGQGVGIRPGLHEGMRVMQGELLGWIGDSGNAETAVPHVHFELRTPWGEPVDPLPSLYSARRRIPSAFLDVSSSRPRFAGSFVDDDETYNATVFDTAVALGFPTWCDEWGVRACPEDPANRVDVALWISMLIDPSDVPLETFAQPVAVVEPEPTRDFIAEAHHCGGMYNCELPVTRGEVASLIVLYEDPASALTPQAALARLYDQGRVDACDVTGLDPEQVLSRASVLKMLLRAWGYLPTPPCGLID